MTRWPSDTSELVQKSVCFTGHRKLSDTETQQLSEQLDCWLRRLYDDGMRRFMDGGALGFDLLAAERVLMLQAEHPDVELVMVIPCSSQTRHWSEEQCARQERILFQASEVRVLSSHYFNGCMMVRNRHMVDRCSTCVCYLNRDKGGTLSTVSYAIDKGLSIINLAMAGHGEADETAVGADST